MVRWICARCGQDHGELPLHYRAHAPTLWYQIPEPERVERAELSSDVCVIDDKYWFVLGNLEIPVLGAAERFSWDVWVSLSERSMKRAAEIWETAGRESEPPYFGWLSTDLQPYPNTLSLKTMVHTREVGVRPFIELEPTDHPLAVEQREGITPQRVREIAEQILHGSSEPESGV